MKTAIAAMLATALAAPVAAEEATITAEQAQQLHDFAKLEANIAELTLAATAYLGVDDAELKAEIAEELEEDIEQVDGYLSRLRGMSLDEEQSEALDKFEKSWNGLAATAQEMTKPDFVAEPAAIAAIWKQATDTDETIDDVLDDLLEALGVEEDETT